MDVADIFKRTFKDDAGNAYRFKRINGHLNLLINGKPKFDSGIPYSLQRNIEIYFGTYDCLQSINGVDLKIYFTANNDEWIAMHGDIQANLKVTD